MYLGAHKTNWQKNIVHQLWCTDGIFTTGKVLKTFGAQLAPNLVHLSHFPYPVLLRPNSAIIRCCTRPNNKKKEEKRERRRSHSFFIGPIVINIQYRRRRRGKGGRRRKKKKKEKKKKKKKKEKGRGRRGGKRKKKKGGRRKETLARKQVKKTGKVTVDLIQSSNSTLHT